MANKIKEVKFKYDPITYEIGEAIDETTATDDGEYITIKLSSEEAELAANNELFDYYTPIYNLNADNEDLQEITIIPTALLDKLKEEATANNTTVGEIIEAALSQELLKKELINTTTIKGVRALDFPIDKINSNAWKLLEKDTGGQIAFDVANTTDKKHKVRVPIFYSIDFEDIDQNITITKKLTPYDKRVYIAIAALFNAGNEIISLSQIYKHMGYKGRAGTSDLEKINNSIIKMLGAKIYLNNEQEIKKYNYSKFIYRGPLLPVETGEVYNINGALTDAAIHVFREPPLITFAAQRNQITKVSLEMLQSPINKTDANLLLEDYLIERIERSRRKTIKLKMETLYKQTKIETEKQRQRLPKKLQKLLDYYIQIGKITNYKIGREELIITLPEK